MFYARNKGKKRQKCRHEQWPLQGRALPREETKKSEQTTKTNISDRKLHHEDNMHYPMWKLTHLTKNNNIFGQKTWFLHEYRNFGQTQKHTHPKKNTTAAPDGLMCGGKKKTHRERMSKIDLGKRKLCHFQEMVWKHPIPPLGNIFS